MSFKRAPVRYGHTPGYTHCTYAADGSKFLTCGKDGDLRIWAGVEDDDPFTQCVGECAVCIVQYDERLLVSTDLNTVQAYTYPDCSRDGTEFHFTGAVTTIKVNQMYMAAGSENMQIKLKAMDNLNETHELLGHDGIILRIDISPDNMLASSSGDGTIKIWDLNRKEVIKTITGLEKVKSFDKAVSYATPTFEPIKGAFLAYPLNKEIIVLDTSTFSQAFILTDEKTSSKYTTCEFSLDGNYLAAGTTSGEISIWDIKKKSTIKGDTKGTDMYAITSICWNPENNAELIYCDITGQWGFIDWDVTSTAKENPSKTKDSTAANDDLDDLYGHDFQFDDNSADKEDEDNENCISLEKLKSDTLKLNGIDQSNDGIPEDDDRLPALSEKYDRTDSRMSELIAPQKTYPLQPAFQPSSTPDYLENRYMCWNHIGLIRLHKSDYKSTIHVEFHDVSINNELILDNSRDHTMASLSSTVVALSGESPSKLTCIVFSKGSSREWSVDMPNCETVLAVTATSKLVALVTDARFLRIFGVMGTQREVISIPGPVIALAGHEDKLLVAYHAAPATEEQFINVMLIQAVGLTLRSRDIKLPLTPPNTKLTWIGFSDRGSPVSCDSMGMLRMYSSKSNLWYPVCDTQLHVKGASDNFFIIEVSEATQTLRAILCRGSCYPLTHPRPIINELPLQLTFCDLEEEKSTLEESLVRWSIFDVDNSEKNIKESAIKLFALSCRSEMEGRARELIEMLASPQLIPLAMKYASKLGRMHLVEKLGDLIPALEQDMTEHETFSSHDQMTPAVEIESSFCSPVIIKVAPKKDTPTIELKPISESRNKRKNVLKPLKPLAHSKSANLLSHLTDKVIGLGLPTVKPIATMAKPVESISTQLSMEESDEIISQDLFGSMENLENDTNKTNTNDLLKLTCGEWFQLNRSDLELEFPNSSLSELTKIGTQRFREMRKSSKLSLNGGGSETESPTPSTSNGGGVKRKLDGSEKKPSSAAKLAKFFYTK